MQMRITISRPQAQPGVRRRGPCTGAGGKAWREVGPQVHLRKPVFCRRQPSPHGGLCVSCSGSLGRLLARPTHLPAAPATSVWGLLGAESGGGALLQPKCPSLLSWLPQLGQASAPAGRAASTLAILSARHRARQMCPVYGG